MTPEQMAQMEQLKNMQGAMAGFGVGMLIFYLIMWVFVAFCWAKLGEKLGVPFGKGFLWSIIPILNVIFILQLAAKPIWWVVLFLIPIVNIVVLVLAFMAIAEKRGKPNWWGILMIVPFANIVVFLMLAFGK